ncbi:CU044_5270 family protein [Sphaerisporangium rhizosphaerae]|uniref:CU044_5270 family protein n=1 Tax=Sphaerisporangium rhizosphaerae TaxID=2269375 RepID=A0ABW2NVB6_9ACTN
MNDLDIVRDLRSQVRQTEEKDLRAVRRRVLASMARRPRVRRAVPRTALRVAAVGALGVAITTSVAVAQNLGADGGRRGTIGAPAWLPAANAETLAKRATEAAAKAADVYPRADQWIYVKNTIYTDPQTMAKSKVAPIGGGKIGSRYTVELWARGDGKKTAHRLGNGRLVTATVNERKRNPQQLGPAYLRSLPLEPSALLERLKKDDSTSGTRRLETVAVFHQVQLLLQGVTPPPRLRAALYTVISRLDGVGVEDKVRDLVGREGIGIYTDEEGFRREIIIDPNTYAFLGLRGLYLSEKRVPGGRTFSKGEVVYSVARLADGIVDHAGDVTSGLAAGVGHVS